MRCEAEDPITRTTQVALCCSKLENFLEDTPGPLVVNKPLDEYEFISEQGNMRLLVVYTQYLTAWVSKDTQADAPESIGIDVSKKLIFHGRTRSYSGSS